jgi:hypothetical protein
MFRLVPVLVSITSTIACGTVAGIDDNDAGEVDGSVSAEIDGGIDAAPTIPPNIVFVTSAFSSADLGGIAGADAMCAAEAAANDLDGTYVAWLSTGFVDARDRLADASGWVRPDGLPVAATVNDLVAGRLLYPINIGADGAARAGNVWTGTDVAGGLEPDSDCGAWTVAASGTATAGRAGSGPVSWTANTSSIGCGRTGRLYCFGVDRAGAIDPPVSTGRTIFVSTTAISGAAGRPAFDAICASEASTAGLSGTYVAVVAQTKVAATTRFNLGDAPWFRPDGVAVVRDAADLVTTETLAPIAVTAAGKYVAGRAWTGALGFGEPSTNHCIDWTDIRGAGGFGVIDDSGSLASSGGTESCTTELPVYCAEQ